MVPSRYRMDSRERARAHEALRDELDVRIYAVNVLYRKCTADRR